MNIVTSYFLVRKLPGTIALGGDVRQHKEERQLEYLDCLRRTQQHPGVASIHLLVEGVEAYQHLVKHVLCNPNFQHSHTPASTPAPRSALHAPLQDQQRNHSSPLAPIVPVVRLATHMPRYADFFAYANQILTDRLTMVCNADVYLSPSSFDVAAVEGLFQSAAAAKATTEAASPPALKEPWRVHLPTPSAKLALALTRYESENVLDAPHLYDYRGSHDAFVFKPPLPLSLLPKVNHEQNGYKAENVVVYELQQHGYLVLNPALDLRLVHRHAADLRQWFPPVDESRYGRAAPCSLHDAAVRLQELRKTEL